MINRTPNTAHTTLENTVQAGIAAGLLPQGTMLDDVNERPWPVEIGRASCRERVLRRV